ncbi:MAG: PAS domain S-box protein [Desulfobacteraceae bacterium]
MGSAKIMIVEDNTEKLRLLKRKLQQVRDNLERAVEVRTAELVMENRELKMEIAERRRSEQALRESEQIYRSIVDHIGIGVALISPQMEILTLNNQMKKWFPYIDVSKRPTCYKAYNDPPGKTICNYCPTHKTLLDGQVYEAITETPAGDKIVNYRLISLPITDADGNVVAAIEMVEEITERLKFKQRLQESETKYRTIFETTAAAKFIVEKDTTISLVNKEFEKLTGCFKKQIEGKKSLLEFLIEEDKEKVLGYHHLRRIDPLSAPNHYECRFIGGKGQIRDGYVTVAMLPGTSKSVVSLLDITDCKQVEKSLRESEQRSRHLSSQLLAAQETERRRISMEIHDELGPSLALLKIRLNAIAGKLRKDQGKLKREVSNANDVITQLIEDTRRLSRDLSPSIIQDLKISGTLKWMLHDFEKHTDIDVQLDMVNIDDRFGIDEQLILYRIFQEALSNVRKHSQARHVNVVIQKIDDCVVIQIEDDGNGFDLEETLNRPVTERGMGLLALYERARMLRGTLGLFSQKNKGTWINLTIPVCN